MKRRAELLGELSTDTKFYWSTNMCFGGYVQKQLPERKTLILDTGSDGNTYTNRFVSSDIIVFIETDE